MYELNRVLSTRKQLAQGFVKTEREVPWWVTASISF